MCSSATSSANSPANASQRRDAMAIAYVAQLLLGSISSMDRHDAALRDANADDIPTRIVFDRRIYRHNRNPTQPRGPT